MQPIRKKGIVKSIISKWGFIAELEDGSELEIQVRGKAKLSLPYGMYLGEEILIDVSPNDATKGRLAYIKYWGMNREISEIPTTIVTTQVLIANLKDPNLVILDASFKAKPVKVPAEYANHQIPNARYFDIKGAFSDTTNPYPNAFPSAAQFEASAQALGINQSSKIVVYDKQGIYSSARVWWMFKMMGHEQVAILDGGLPAWIADGYLTEEAVNQDIAKGDFKAKLNEEGIKNIDFVKSNIENPSALIVDARSAGRFNGTEPEPRAGLRGGCIPNSVSIPFQSLLENGKMKSTTALAEIFKPVQQADKSLVFSCGSGITACVVLLASELVFQGKKGVYDGSWTEWAQEVSA